VFKVERAIFQLYSGRDDYLRVGLASFNAISAHHH
jgi:hypothetical protein